MKRVVYDKQFKMAAVKMAQEAEQSVLETAKALGISGRSLRRWINEYDKYGESAFPGHGNALFRLSKKVKQKTGAFYAQLHTHYGSPPLKIRWELWCFPFFLKNM